MAGTINTTNYNFKKYAPNDTVSMLQTFNGNMDAIDRAIKDRADVETEQGASITKLENGLASTNNGLNSANQTISAVQVQVTTNTRNIQTANTELDTLDARVQALEDGGSSISPLSPTMAVATSQNYNGYYRQGNHLFGNGYYVVPTTLAENLLSITSADNIAIPSAVSIVKLISFNGNLFNLNPNIGHAVGISTSLYQDKETYKYLTNISPLYAIFDGNTTYIGSPGKVDNALTHFTASLDVVI